MLPTAEGREVVRDGPLELPGAERLPRAVVRAIPKLASGRFVFGMLGETARFLTDAGRILAGSSSVEPDARTRQFEDPAWSANPFYRRLMQLYLATGRLALAIPDQADIDWVTAERLRFLISQFVDAASPTNTLVGNPAALRRAVQTRGRSLANGARNLADDMRAGRRLPARSDHRSFRLGEDVASTAGAVVYRTDLFELIQYAPSTPTVLSTPLLHIPSVVNRHYVMDLTPKRSLAKYGVDRGVWTFSIVWRNPGPDLGDRGLDDYVAAALEAIDAVTDITGSEAVNITGFCAAAMIVGGLLGHMAHAGDRRVASATILLGMLHGLIVEPPDVHSFQAVIRLADRRLVRGGVVKGRDIAALLRARRPNGAIWPFWARHYLLGERPAPDEMLYWADEDQNLTAALVRDLARLHESSALLQPDGTEVLGAPIDLAKVDCDAYVIGAQHDQTIPWKAAYRAVETFGGPTEFVLSPTGHVQTLFMGPRNLRAQFIAGGEIGEGPDHWRATAETRSGSWWSHWLRWLEERSGDRVAAPSELGNGRFPAGDPAPGPYAAEAPPQ